MVFVVFKAWPIQIRSFCLWSILYHALGRILILCPKVSDKISFGSRGFHEYVRKAITYHGTEKESHRCTVLRTCFIRHGFTKYSDHREKRAPNKQSQEMTDERTQSFVLIGCVVHSTDASDPHSRKCNERGAKQTRRGGLTAAAQLLAHKCIAFSGWGMKQTSRQSTTVRPVCHWSKGKGN
jgi:hypothetical protein